MKKGNGKDKEAMNAAMDVGDAPTTFRTKKSTEYLKYDFLREEKEQMGIDLAHKFNELSYSEANKKAIVKAIDSEIAGLEAKTREIATKLNNGHEYRNIDVEITFDYETRLKKYVRLDTQEQYKEVPMTSDELQVPLPIMTESDAVAAEEVTS
jgi:hypothetical protein